MKKNFAVVLGSTKNYFPATGTVIMGLKEFSPELADDILIFYDDVSEQDKYILTDTLGCKLIKFKPKYKLNIRESTLIRFRLLSFSIYEIFRLLRFYKNVLWLDSDVCIMKDISPILRYSPFGIRYGGTIYKDALGISVHPDIDEKMTSNTGVVFVNDALKNYEELYKQCYDYTSKFGKTLHLPDQAIINYVLWKNKIEPNYFPATYNFTVYHPLFEYSNAAIFHCACDSKFWDNTLLNGAFPIWRKHYDEWVKLGGSQFKGYELVSKNQLDTLTACLNKIAFSNLHEMVKSMSQEILIKEQDKIIKKLTKHAEDLLTLLQLKNTN